MHPDLSTIPPLDDASLMTIEEDEAIQAAAFDPTQGQVQDICSGDHPGPCLWDL